MAHLVSDHVTQGAARLHLLQIGGVEGHHTLGRQQRGGARGGRTQYGRPGLAEDATRAVDVGALREDQDVVDGLPVGDHRWQVADDHPGPAVGRGGEGRLLRLGQTTEEPDLDGERGLGGGQQRGPPASATA